MKKLFVLILFCFLFGCNSSKSLKSLKLISADGTKTIDLEVEVVDTESSRQVGLMYRKELPTDQGMLFVFPTEEARSFWMKNTFLELDILFFNSKKELVSVVKRAVPLTETRRESKVPAQYVLEVIGGSVELWGFGEGARFEIQQ